MASPSKPAFERLVTLGGDERLDIRGGGYNKYHVYPVEYQRVFNRASCTCSPFSENGFRAAKALYEKLSDDTFDHVRRQHTSRIKELLNLPGCDRFDVFYAPSGSDLCYYPLLFSKLIHPDRDIFNIITCPEELGSGSNVAFAGRYYSSRNQLGAVTAEGTAIDPALKISCATFAARDEQGRIMNHKHQIESIIHEKYRSHAVVANIVIGSKSGIENNSSILATTPEDVLWTVDLCQFRASRVLINGLIGMNACVMLTGSKFYHSPPFCAVLLVPKTISQRFNRATDSAVTPFASVFTAYDIPERFTDIRQWLPGFRNFGLLLRWEAALAEMTEFAALDMHAVNRVILLWNQHVSARMRASQHFDLMPGQEDTNKTIISFRVRSNRGYLSHAQLGRMYETLCTRTHRSLANAERVLFGQPVKYGQQSFVRLALSSADVQAFVRQGLDLTNDEKLIAIIEEYAENEGEKDDT